MNKFQSKNKRLEIEIDSNRKYYCSNKLAIEINKHSSSLSQANRSVNEKCK